MTEPALPDPAYLTQIDSETQRRLLTAVSPESSFEGAPEDLRAALGAHGVDTAVGAELHGAGDGPSLPIRTNGALTGRWVQSQQWRGRNPLPAGVVSDTWRRPPTSVTSATASRASTR
ncbi:hypothetical protein [Arthrobacter sp. TMN-50]